MKQPPIPLFLVIAAVHEASVRRAVPQPQDVPRLMGRRRQVTAQAKVENGPGIAVAVEGQDPDALPSIGILEEEVPASPRPQVGSGECLFRQGVSRILRFQNLLEDVPRQYLTVAPGGIPALRYGPTCGIVT